VSRGTLATLRDLMPPRALSQVEALRIAELQAARLLKLCGIRHPPVPTTVITEVPKIVVERMIPWPVSGATHWTKGTWAIVINGKESSRRQRFTLAHEFKHILDYRHIDIAYPSTQTMSHRQRIESTCDFFAGCLLVPRPWLRSAWQEGMHDLKDLADAFEVSVPAIRTRLVQTGLVDSGDNREDNDDTAVRFSAVIGPRKPYKRASRIRRKRCGSLEAVL
jgi:Zn-dependent peptidase ImmA (M78 family)